MAGVMGVTGEVACAVTRFCHAWAIGKLCKGDDFSMWANGRFEAAYFIEFKWFLLGVLCPLVFFFLIGRGIVLGFEVESASEIHPSDPCAGSFAAWTLGNSPFWSVAAVYAADVVGLFKCQCFVLKRFSVGGVY